MASLADIQRAFGSKQALTLDRDYRGSKQVGFVGDKANIGGAEFSNAQDLYNTVYGGGSGGGSSSTGGYNSSGGLSTAISDATSAIRAQLDPITKQLEGIKPMLQKAAETKQNALKGTLTSLGERYKALLADITGKGKAQETTQTRVTNNELARRGITGDSTEAQQETIRALEPILENTRSLTTQAGVAQASDERSVNDAIANVPIEQAMQEAELTKRIADILTGGVSQGVSLGGSLFQTQMADSLSKTKSESDRMFDDLKARLMEQQLASGQQSIDQGNATAPLLLEKLRAEVNKAKSSGGNKISLDALDALW